MVIYAASANVSVTGMFLAGIIPGVIIGLSLMLYAWTQARREGVGADLIHYTPREAWDIIWDAKWALIVPVIILGGIYGGIFTPTEAAAVGVIYGLVVGMFVYRELRLTDLYHVFAQSALTTGSVMLIVGAATIFGRVLTIERIPVILAEGMVEFVSSPLTLLFLVNVLLLVVGTFMETLAAIIILTPILLPVATAMGIDPTHFGIVMIVNLGIGMVTPPLGMNLFIGAKVGDVPLEQVMRGAIPFVIVMLFALALITYLPILSLVLPQWLAN